MRLGDVCATLEKTSNVNISKKVSNTPYFFRRNRDLGTISVCVGYRDVRFLTPLYVYMVSLDIVSAN